MRRLSESMSGAPEERRAPLGTRMRLLEGKVCLEAEGLWREAFDGDTACFTDYYFSHKAAKNRGLVLEGEDGVRAMLYLTPERMLVMGHPAESAYIVGVATRKQYRRRGYMAALLKEALRMLYEERMPFVFLMPASPDIYTPFGFTYIYDRPLWEEGSLRRERLTVLTERDAGRMADFAQDFLKREKAVYVCRDRAYYITQLMEAAAQEGCIFGYEEPEGDKKLKGLCAYTCEEGSPEILEVLADAETERRFVERKPGRTPAIMARIVCLERMLSRMRSDEPFSFVLAVKDELIAQNNGSFFCEVKTDGTRVRDCRGDAAPDAALSVAELAAVLFGYERTENRFLQRIQPFSPVWINEIV